MAHIAPQRDRQYFAHELDGNTVSQGIKAIGNSVSNALNTGVSIVQKANESTLANNQIDLNAKFMAKNNEINTKYQADPTNPERENEIKQAFDSLADKYKINPLCTTQWNEIKNKVYNNYKTYNAEWSLKQQQSNIQTNFQNGYKQMIDNISMMGLNNASIDEVRLFYANNIDALKRGAASLGEMYVNDALKNSNREIMASYMVGLAQNNPLQANKLIKNKGVRNDIGNADDIEKLENYISNSLLNQNKKTAVNELCSSLRGMQSAEANKILNGQSNLMQVTKFLNTHKQLPQGSKDLILDIYGLGSKTKYYYDRDSQKIVSAPSGGGSSRGGYSGGSSGSGGLVDIKKMTTEQKAIARTNLETSIGQMFFFSDDEKKVIKAKDGAKKGLGKNLSYRMQMLSAAQGAVDMAYKTGVITSDIRDSLMKKYIAPMTDYLNNNLVNLDEKNHVFGTKLGYDRIIKTFNPKSKNVEEQRNLLTAQSFYYSALEKACRQYGLGSIYDLETLSGSEQRKLYKTAADAAIANTKKYCNHPELFLKAEYPQYYSQGVMLFGLKDGQVIAQKVAKQLYQDPNNKSDVKEIMSKVISDYYALKHNNNLKTQILLYSQKHGERWYSNKVGAELIKYSHEHPTMTSAQRNAEYSKRLKEFEKQRIKKLGLKEADIYDTVRSYKGRFDSSTYGYDVTVDDILSLYELRKGGFSVEDLHN